MEAVKSFFSSSTQQKTPSTSEGPWQKVALVVAILGIAALAAGVICFVKHYLAFHWTVTMMGAGGALLLAALILKLTQRGESVSKIHRDPSLKQTPVSRHPQRELPFFGEVMFLDRGTLTIKKGAHDTLVVKYPSSTAFAAKWELEEHQGNTKLLRILGSDRPETPSYTLTLKDPSRLTWVGTRVGDVSVENSDFHNISFHSEISGNFTVSGRCENLAITLCEGGHFEGENLNSQNARVFVQAHDASTFVHLGNVENEVSGSIERERGAICRYSGNATLATGVDPTKFIKV